MVAAVLPSDAYTREKKTTLQIYLRTLQLAGWDCSNIEVHQKSSAWLLDLLADNGVLRLDHLDVVQARIERCIQTATGNRDSLSLELVALLQRRRQMILEYEAKLDEQVEKATGVALLEKQRQAAAREVHSDE